METGPQEKDRNEAGDSCKRSWIKPELVVLDIGETRAASSGITFEAGPPFQVTS